MNESTFGSRPTGARAARQPSVPNEVLLEKKKATRNGCPSHMAACSVPGKEDAKVLFRNLGLLSGWQGCVASIPSLPVCLCVLQDRSAHKMAAEEAEQGAVPYDT